MILKQYDVIINSSSCSKSEQKYAITRYNTVTEIISLIAPDRYVIIDFTAINLLKHEQLISLTLLQQYEQMLSK